MIINEYITPIALLISLLSVIYAIYNNRKTIYINTITTARIKYLENFRILIADFCSIILSEYKNYPDLKNLDTILRLSILIKLHLDKDHTFDIIIIDKINIIIDQLYSGKIDTLEFEINFLIEYAQDICMLEWRGITNEAIKGILSKKIKRNLVDKHLK